MMCCRGQNNIYCNQIGNQVNGFGFSGFGGIKAVVGQVG